MNTEFIWQHIDQAGWEHVRMQADHPGWTVFDSIFVRQQNGEVHRGGYTLVIDKQWRTLELRFMLETSPGAMEGVHLLTEGDGKWTDANENPMPELDGCLDVDIQWSPLTNSLPINRLSMTAEAGEKQIRVAYIALPGLSVTPVSQNYARLGDGVVQYRTDLRDGQTDLEVDSDGFVVNYPDRFQRNWPN